VKTAEINFFSLKNYPKFHAVRSSAKDFERRGDLTVESASGEKNT
jgi:hypothetical protein